MSPECPEVRRPGNSLLQMAHGVGKARARQKLECDRQAAIHVPSGSPVYAMTSLLLPRVSVEFGSAVSLLGQTLSVVESRVAAMI